METIVFNFMILFHHFFSVFNIGVGGILKVFNVTSNKCVLEEEVFKGHKIYGIEPYSERLLLIYGSKEARIFFLFFEQPKYVKSEPAKY